ncbi:Hypothetical predicted protein [Pelobates cultripes]|uniref:Uncharacterized protein n=1 Tax=Pelobates cultripes TaxID=61616 RepID=A0AAD1SCJ2_PELCU|nr:Hypothetical predicted protein [Pelobates cultripes]
MLTCALFGVGVVSRTREAAVGHLGVYRPTSGRTVVEALRHVVVVARGDRHYPRGWKNAGRRTGRAAVSPKLKLVGLRPWSGYFGAVGCPAGCPLDRRHLSNAMIAISGRYLLVARS